MTARRLLRLTNHPALALLWFLVLLVAGCSSSSTPTGQPQTSQPSIPLHDCQLSAAGSSQHLPAQCGSLTVAEDPATGAGPQIQLRIAVIPAVSRNAAPDPLFYLAGGPGEAATEAFVSQSYAFSAINQKRAIVLVDQRGTGGSNPLDCASEELTDTAVQPENAELSDAQLKDEIDACLAGLEADPRLYTTPIAMNDLDQVRAALGYEQINLYGISYGTRAALVYLRQYPQRVRAVILDGVAPPQIALGEASAGDAQRALDLIFKRCAASAECVQAFPALPEEFQSLLATLESTPIQVTLDHPLTGKPASLTLTSVMLGSAVRLLSYSPETVALLPMLIHTANTAKDYRPLAALYLMISAGLEDTISIGMHNSVICAEDVPFYSAAAIQQANVGSYLGDYQAEQLQRICSLWPHAALPAGIKDPVQSNVPVLILSGEADPVTPPAYGELAAASLPNSLHLILPEQGHGVIFRGCLPRLAADFVAASSFRELDTACTQDLRSTPFFVNYNSPQP